MKKKITKKDTKDWNNFTISKKKVFDKDESLDKIIDKNTKSFIDLHGLSLESANKFIEKLINDSFKNGIKKITVVTGKGNRSNVGNNPYLSRELSILKNSVPEFVKSNPSLMEKIKKISGANINDRSSGVFYIYLKSK